MFSAIPSPITLSNSVPVAAQSVVVRLASFPRPMALWPATGKPRLIQALEPKGFMIHESFELQPRQATLAIFILASGKSLTQ